jgi:hypothetical protein
VDICHNVAVSATVFPEAVAVAPASALPDGAEAVVPETAESSS